LHKILYIFLYICASFLYSSEPINYKYDDTEEIAITQRIKSSHLKVSMPSLPYYNILSLINGTLVRLSDSNTGWEYYLADKHQKVDELTYDFWLREDVKYQDGSKFDADSVVENFKYFKKGPFLYSNIHNALDYVEKLNNYKIRIHLKEPYGMLLNDLCVISFYTKEYYEKFNSSPSLTAQNTKGPGRYGAGPYIMVEGYATGLEQSEKIVLKANPYFYEKNKPYVETITIYTQLTTQEVIDKISKKEGELDIAYIPFDKKTEIVNSKYSKLITSSSNSTFTVHMNIIKEESKFKDVKVRQALNDALNQDNLIKFTFKNEAIKSPFLLSANAYYSKDISKKYNDRKSRFTEKELFDILNGLELKVITQDRFMFAWKGIEYQLLKYGVKLNYTVTNNEKFVLKQLLENREDKYDWDLLIWGTDDWYGHPWTGLFTLYTKANWSSVATDDYLVNEYKELFKLDVSDEKFQKKVDDLLLYSYDKAYTLVLPSPNIVLALNKEVIYKPSKMALFPLWNAKITPYHYSIRGDKILPEQRLEFLYPKRLIK
jgi:peptide/nickel transport system substrate-binding protein